MDCTLKLLETSLITGTYLSLEQERIDTLELVNEQISGCHYKQIEFTKVDFENCIFQAGEFHGANFVNCRFENCSFEFIRFADCIFIGCEFINCSFGRVLANECLGENNYLRNCEFELSSGFKFLFEDEVRISSLGKLHQQISVMEAMAA